MKNLKDFFFDEDLITEKAKSKSQQRFMGMVHAVQKGEIEAPSKEVEKAASSMKKKDAKDFAKTKHKGLPNKVKTEAKKKQEQPVLSKQELYNQVRELLAQVRNNQRKGNTELASIKDKELAIVQRQFRNIKENAELLIMEFAKSERILTGIHDGSKKEVEILIKKVMKDLKLSRSVAIIALEHYFDTISKTNTLRLGKEGEY